MAHNVRALNATPEAVFRVFDDGWLFPSWVVGASRMRSVDEDWPAPGSRLHHSVGTWPALLDDNTEVLEYDPPRRFVLQARGWPVGEARVTLEVKPFRGGSLVRIEEHASSGPATLVPTPLMDVAIRLRNAETLRRLAYLAEGIARAGRAGGGAAASAPVDAAAEPAAVDAAAEPPVDSPYSYGDDGVSRTSEASRPEGGDGGAATDAAATDAAATDASAPTDADEAVTAAGAAWDAATSASGSDAVAASVPVDAAAEPPVDSPSTYGDEGVSRTSEASRPEGGDAEGGDAEGGGVEGGDGEGGDGEGERG